MTANVFLEAQLVDALAAQPIPQRYLVALSGGVDSTVLLHALVAILPSSALIIALHGNHQISTESSNWVKHCEIQCARLGVDFVCADLVLAVRGNLEGASREARYEFFANNMRAGDLLLLGQHADDQLETAFLRLFQGRGLISMRHQGDLGLGQFLRPLLNLSRSDLVAYAQASNLTWIEDPSNGDIRFDRNFLRHQIVPMLQKRWPGITQALLRVTGQTSAQQALLRHLIKDLADEVPFNKLPDDTASQLLWLRTYLSVRGHFAVSDRALSEWLRQAQSAEQSELKLDESGFLRSWRGGLYYSKRTQVLAFDGALLALGESVSGCFGCLELVQCNSDEEDAFIYSGPVEIVCRGELNDVSLSRSFGSASLKTLFQQGNIPPWRRDEYPLIMCKDELVAVPGIASRLKIADTQLDGHPRVWCRGILRS